MRTVVTEEAQKPMFYNVLALNQNIVIVMDRPQSSS